MGCGWTAYPVQAGYVVTLQEVGPNVVATGSGAIDLTGLMDGGREFGGPVIAPDNGAISTGSTGFFQIYTGFSVISGPTSFGRGAIPAFNGMGDYVGINGAEQVLFVPQDYVSGNALSDSAIYPFQTFASLGVTPGTYKWRWGDGVNQNFTLQIQSTERAPALGDHNFTQAQNVPFIMSSPLAVMANSSVYVAISVANSHTVTRVTDSAGNSLTKAAHASRGSIETEVWYIDGVNATSSYSVTAAFSGNAHATIEVAEIRGAGRPSFDGAGTGTGHSSVPTATVTSSGSNEFGLLSVATANNGSQSFSAVPPDFAIDASPVPAPGGQNIAGADLGESLSAAGSYTLSANVTGHGSASVDFAAVAVTIKP